MKILSLQIGKPKTLDYRGKSITTGIFKDPVPGPLYLRKLNLDGDGQANLKVHGGPDKALYVYAYDAYTHWKKLRTNDTFSYGAMGENVTCSELNEDTIYVGDTFECGEAIIQACQPRFPCYKLAMKFDDVNILKQFNVVNRPGIYFRVLKEGLINTGDSLKLTDQEKVKLSILELYSFSQKPIEDESRIHDFLKIKALTPQWRAKFESWI